MKNKKLKIKYTSMENSENTIARIMMQLIQTAANDGILTAEEEELLGSINNSLVFYKNSLDVVISDGVITQEEHDHLVKIKDIIINAATLLAGESDDEISRDEMNLIIGLMVSINIPKPTV